MTDYERRGMLIRNNGTERVRVSLASRSVEMDPGEEEVIAPEEVRDPALRAALRERSIAIVRPATEKEEQGLQDRLSNA